MNDFFVCQKQLQNLFSNKIFLQDVSGDEVPDIEEDTAVVIPDGDTTEVRFIACTKLFLLLQSR